MPKTLSFLTSVFISFFAMPALAHVKWFTRESLAQAPLKFAALNTPTFWGLLALSVVTLMFLVWLDRKLELWPAYTKMNLQLEQYSDRATIVLRIFTGAALLLSWQADSMIAPELTITSDIWGWFQFALALLLLFRTTTPVAGLGMMLLYAVAASQYGIYHLLDYVIYFGIGVYFLLSNSTHPKIKDLRIPALYSSLGFSLFWVALEKIFFPSWGLDILAQKPALTMGLPHDFFLMAAAFVELCLGYLLIICLLQRPLSLIITLVFFTTTAFFGKTEVVGHTLLHGALIVFIIVGQKGSYMPPIAFHKKTSLRMAFAAVNFLFLLVLLGYPYRELAVNAHQNFEKAHGIEHSHEHE